MIKIPYRYLVLGVLAAAAAIMLFPPARGSSEDVQTDDKELIAVERIEGDTIFFHNHAHMFSEKTEGVTAGELQPGDWLLVSTEEEGRDRILLTVERAPDDVFELTGAVGGLLTAEGEAVGFTLNNFSILFPEEAEHGGSGRHLEIGLGVRVKATPERGTSVLRATSFPEVIRHHSLLHAITMLVLQIAVILLFAKVGGEVFERFFGQPGVLGELVAGMVISPYALGGMIVLPGGQKLFETVDLSTVLAASPLQPDFAVSPELWAVAQIAAVILLFMAGLETDLGQFLRYAGPATVIGLGGVITPFFLGALATVWFIPGISSVWDPTAMFMGAIMVATSVGITARVLSDIHRLDTSEGVTILAGAVIDDVLGILVLAIVNAIAMAQLINTPIDVNLILGITLKAVLFWLGLTGIGILVSGTIEKFLVWFRTKGATMGVALAICFAAAATAEMFGLAMIIGAYSIGLAMSDRPVSHFLEDALTGAYNFVVPIFFTVMGMMVDFQQMMPLFWPYGVVISFFAIISKVFGCGIPALFVGFNLRGAYRVGLGMLPRGEVALIIAGVGIANGVIQTDMFGVAILITMVTTLMAPPLLVPAFQRGGVGTLREESEKVVLHEPEPLILIHAVSALHQRFVRDLFISFLEDNGYGIVYGDAPAGVYELQKEGAPVVIRELDEDFGVSVDAPTEFHDEVRTIISGVADFMREYQHKIAAEIGEQRPQEI